MAVAALQDKEYYKNLKESLIETRTWFMSELNNMKGIRAFHSDANFIFVDFNETPFPKSIKDVLQKDHGILVRLFDYNGHQAMRITVGPKPEMEEILSVFHGIAR
jgi:histidinol-phosphate/aromatic aminotransferase/cobyric acid decarboxylase-like protein